jgi:hypothetical protein
LLGVAVPVDGREPAQALVVGDDGRVHLLVLRRVVGRLDGKRDPARRRGRDAEPVDVALGRDRRRRRARDGRRPLRHVVRLEAVRCCGLRRPLHRSTECCVRVDDPVAVRLVDAARADVVRGRQHALPGLFGAPGGILRAHERDHAGDDRRGERRAVAGAVRLGCAADACRRPDAHTGSGDVDVVAPAREVRELRSVLPGPERRDGNGVLVRGGIARYVPAGVARCCDDVDVVRGRVRERVLQHGRRSRAAQREIDDLCAVVGCEGDTRRDVGVGAGPVRAEHLDRQHVDVPRKPRDSDAVVPCRRSDPGHHRAVPVVVVRRAVVVHEVPARVDPAGEIGCVEVDAGVDDGDRHRTGARPDVPALRGPDDVEIPRLVRRVQRVVRRAERLSDVVELYGCNARVAAQLGCDGAGVASVRLHDVERRLADAFAELEPVLRSDRLRLAAEAHEHGRGVMSLVPRLLLRL